MRIRTSFRSYKALNFHELMELSCPTSDLPLCYTHPEPPGQLDKQRRQIGSLEYHYSVFNSVEGDQKVIGEMHNVFLELQFWDAAISKARLELEVVL